VCGTSRRLRAAAKKNTSSFRVFVCVGPFVRRAALFILQKKTACLPVSFLLLLIILFFFLGLLYSLSSKIVFFCCFCCCCFSSPCVFFPTKRKKKKKGGRLLFDSFVFDFRHLFSVRFKIVYVFFLKMMTFFLLFKRG